MSKYFTDKEFKSFTSYCHPTSVAPTKVEIFFRDWIFAPLEKEIYWKINANLLTLVGSIPFYFATFMTVF